MDAKIKKANESSVHLMTRVSPDLHEKIERLWKERGFRNKSTFVEFVLIEFVRCTEGDEASSTEGNLVALAA